MHLKFEFTYDRMERRTGGFANAVVFSASKLFAVVAHFSCVFVFGKHAGKTSVHLPLHPHSMLIVFRITPWSFCPCLFSSFSFDSYCVFFFWFIRCPYSLFFLRTFQIFLFVPFIVYFSKIPEHNDLVGCLIQVKTKLQWRSQCFDNYRVANQQNANNFDLNPSIDMIWNYSSGDNAIDATITNCIQNKSKTGIQTRTKSNTEFSLQNIQSWTHCAFNFLFTCRIGFYAKPVHVRCTALCLFHFYYLCVVARCVFCMIIFILFHWASGRWVLFFVDRPRHFFLLLAAFFCCS